MSKKRSKLLDGLLFSLGSLRKLRLKFLVKIDLLGKWKKCLQLRRGDLRIELQKVKSSLDNFFPPSALQVSNYNHDSSLSSYTKVH